MKLRKWCYIGGDIFVTSSLSDTTAIQGCNKKKGKQQKLELNLFN